MKKLIWILLIILLVNVAVFVGFPSSEEGFIPYAGTLTTPAVPKTQDIARIQVLEEKIRTLEEGDKKSRVDYLFALAAEQKIQGQWQEAKRSLEKALFIKYDAHILHAYATLLFEMGAGNAAIAYIDDALKIASDVPNFWYTKIQFTHALTDDRIILENLYTQALKKTKEDIDMIALYAAYLSRIGDRDNALRYWKKAIEKNPNQRALYEAEIAQL